MLNPLTALRLIDAKVGMMFDQSAQAVMQRSHGNAMVRFALRGDQIRLRDLSQSGSAKAMLPRVSGAVPEVVFLNTSGGLTGGDHLSYQMDIGAGARITATTQTAERAYASTGLPADVSVRATVGQGGRLDWLPQETLIYENAHLHRSTEIDLAEGASCLLAEAVVLGRHAMGERPMMARLTDTRVIRRMGRPVWTERLSLNPQILARATDPAILGDARAFAIIALVAEDAHDHLTHIRMVLDEPACRCAASGWDGRLLIRILAADGWPLRKQIARVLLALRDAPLPRVW
jgi:urease accessory protein